MNFTEFVTRSALNKQITVVDGLPEILKEVKAISLVDSVIVLQRKVGFGQDQVGDDECFPGQLTSVNARNGIRRQTRRLPGQQTKDDGRIKAAGHHDLLSLLRD